MTQRGIQMSIPGCEATATRDTGGTNGGGREREARNEPSIRCVIMWDAGTHKEPDEPECFWAYWLNDDVLPKEARGDSR